MFSSVARIFTRNQAAAHPVPVVGNAIQCRNVGEAIATLAQNPPAGKLLQLATEEFINDLAKYPKGSLGNAISNNMHIEELSCNDIFLTVALSNEVVLGLGNNSRIQSLTLAGVRFGPKAVQLIADVIRNVDNIRKFKLGSREVTPQQLRKLTDAVAESSVEAYHIASAPFDSSGSLALGRTIVKSQQLNELRIECSNVESEPGARIGRTIRLALIEKLSFFNCNIGDSSVVLLARSLSSSPYVFNASKSLDLSIIYCKMSNVGALALASLIEENPLVNHLDVRGNNLSTVGVKIFVRSGNAKGQNDRFRLRFLKKRRYRRCKSFRTSH